MSMGQFLVNKGHLLFLFGLEAEMKPCGYISYLKIHSDITFLA